MNKPYKDKKWLQNKYNELLFSKTIGDSIGVSGDTIEYWRKKHGIEKPRPSFAPNRKHFYNDSFFETIDTEEKAYWLGFLMADGAITKTSKNDKKCNRMSICLKQEDVEHINKFKKIINASTVPIKEKEIISKGHVSTTCELRLSSIKICDDLSKYGVVHNKTGYECIPDNIPKDLIKHYVRGFFDGDGCIYLNTKGYYCFSIGTASEKMLNQLDMFFKENEIECYKEINNHYRVPFYTIGTNKQKNVLKMFNLLYDNSNIYLDRKYDKFRKICPVNK